MNGIAQTILAKVLFPAKLRLRPGFSHASTARVQKNLRKGEQLQMESAQKEKTPSPDNAPEAAAPSHFRMRLGLGMTLFGFIVFMIGARPAVFFLDRSPVVGFIQIAVFLVGLALICVGGYIGLMAFWQNGDRTIAADIGQRLVATGYVIAVFSGMADIFGLGTRPPPEYVPYFGPLQAIGVEIGMGIIVVGFLLLLPYRRGKPAQSGESPAQA